MAKLLLAGVFKPYGVHNEWGESLCTMELLNNQVTREQGIHSPRSNNPSFALYILAENISVPATVLDFPSWRNFTKEVRKGKYTHIGISFIVPNVLRVRRMARYIRKHSPAAKIILGGHGAAIPDLDKLVDYDDICRGEGVRWLRRYFGEDPDKPISHPVVHSAVSQRIYGAPIIRKAGIIITGVGCQNSCNFCATSHKFEKRYTPFLRNGREIFEACVKTEKALGLRDFALMDENFFKVPKRARQLLEKMEKHGKVYTFSTFSSAETIVKLGVDFLLRMGIKFLWIGVESKEDIYAKTKGIDMRRLITELQNKGITVLASSILFLEHHDKETIAEDIDWAIELESDFLQFMQYGPIPGTTLYKEYHEKNKLIENVPWPSQHGQGEIWFRHPHFTLPETFEYTKKAFARKFQTHGPGVVNMAHTYIKGYINALKEMKERMEKRLAWNPETLRYEKQETPKPDTYMEKRLEVLKDNAIEFRPILQTSLKYAPNKKVAEKCRMVIELFNETLGKPAMSDRIMSTAVKTCAFFENIKAKRGVVMRQPSVYKIKYRQGKAVTLPIPAGDSRLLLRWGAPSAHRSPEGAFD